jgi:hypothetical protein
MEWSLRPCKDVFVKLLSTQLWKLPIIMKGLIAIIIVSFINC